MSTAAFNQTMPSIEDLAIDLPDRWGLTVLHRAAAYGTYDDILSLLERGISLHILVDPLSWNAVFHSIYQGNSCTLTT